MYGKRLCKNQEKLIVDLIKPKSIHLKTYQDLSMQTLLVFVRPDMWFDSGAYLLLVVS